MMKKETEENKGRRKGSLMEKLLVLAIGPTLVLAVAVTLYASVSMTDGMQQEFLSGLKDTAYSLRAAYQALDPGDYSLNDAGELLKGQLNVSADEELIDSFVEGTNMAVTVLYGDTRMATSLISKENGERIVGTKASDEVTETVIEQGQEYESTDLTINEQDYYAYYVPLTNSDGSIVGMIFVGEPSADIDSFIIERVKNTILICIVIVLIVIVIAIWSAKRIINALAEAERVLTQVSEGNLTVSVDGKALKRSDEIGVMARSLNTTIEKLRNIITHIFNSTEVLMQEGTQLSEMSEQTSRSTTEVSRAIEEISNGAVTQAEEVEGATQLVSSMGHQIEDIVANINELFQVSEKMQKAGQNAQENMNLLQASNEQTNAAIGKVAENVEKTDHSVEAISETLTLITDIADETNLLSLNASIEAARAGEAGKGFAVVAGQIQKLAEESNASASKIEEIISTLAADSANTLSVMDELRNNIKVQQEKMADTIGKFEDVSGGIVTSNDSTKYIQKQASDCDASRISVVDIIQNLSALSEENAAATEQTTASMEELNSTIKSLAKSAGGLQELALSLENEIKFFQI
jgi:methyl-accepting chemotaxis protein